MCGQVPSGSPNLRPSIGKGHLTNSLSPLVITTAMTFGGHVAVVLLVLLLLIAILIGVAFHLAPVILLVYDNLDNYNWDQQLKLI